MANHVCVNSNDHRTLQISAEKSARMGDNVMSCLTFFTEFRNVQAHYPILFQRNAERDEFCALAMFGLERGENLFVQDEAWDARYIPLAMDVQPFLIGLPRHEEGNRQVHIDMDSPRIMRSGEQAENQTKDRPESWRVFDENGQPSAHMEVISARLGALHEGYQSNSDYLAALQEHDLLEPFMLETDLDDGSSNRLIGFHIINEEKLADLDSRILGELNEAGFLQPSFMALASLSHLVDLIKRKNARLPHA